MRFARLRAPAQLNTSRSFSGSLLVHDDCFSVGIEDTCLRCPGSTRAVKTSRWRLAAIVAAANALTSVGGKRLQKLVAVGSRMMLSGRRPVCAPASVERHLSVFVGVNGAGRRAWVKRSGATLN